MGLTIVFRDYLFYFDSSFPENILIVFPSTLFLKTKELTLKISNEHMSIIRKITRNIFRFWETHSQPLQNNNINNTVQTLNENDSVVFEPLPEHFVAINQQNVGACQLLSAVKNNNLTISKADIKLTDTLGKKWRTE